MLKHMLVLIAVLMVVPGCTTSGKNVRFSGEVAARGSAFTQSEPGKDSFRGEVRISPKVEYTAGKGTKLVASVDIREGHPTEIYDQDFWAYRSGKGKPAGLLQEMYLDQAWKGFDFRVGRFKPEDKIKFDFFRMNPFASIDSSEPFLSLDSDRLLGNWGVLAGYSLGPVAFEAMVFSHEDPILATSDDDRWTRPLPFGLGYGDFEYSRPVDWGARLSGKLKSAQWELTFFNGSSQNVNNLELDLRKGEFDLVFPEQTSIEAAVQVPVAMFNLRLGASHNWRRWHGENAGQFLNFISELEYAKEGVFKGGDNLLLEAGYADVWDTASSDVFQDNLGIDQIYRGGSFLFTAEYSPREDWVLKVRTIFNAGHGSIYFSPEIRKIFFSGIGELNVYVRGMYISGNNSNDIISAYSGGSNAEIGLVFRF